MKKILETLLEAPDRQLDKSIIERLKTVKDKSNGEIATELNACLNDCARYSLASDFVMHTLNLLYEYYSDNA